MSDTTVSDKGDFQRELPPEGSTKAVFWMPFNVGLQPQKNGPAQHKVLLYWETSHRYKTGDFKGKRILISQMYSANLGKNAWLRRDVQRVLGRGLTEQEVKGFELKSLKGKGCRIQIIHENGWANV
jgi:hypothetical protein